jgi:hypothetical protein
MEYPPVEFALHPLPSRIDTIIYDKRRGRLTQPSINSWEHKIAVEHPPSIPSGLVAK